MRLDEDFARQMLQTPWQDWTPEIAESVRRHFLGPWFHKAHFAKLTLRQVLSAVTALHTYGPENLKLEAAADHYAAYLMQHTESHAHKAQAPDL
jgi:hypothetical protein